MYIHEMEGQIQRHIAKASVCLCSLSLFVVCERTVSGFNGNLNKRHDGHGVLMCNGAVGHFRAGTLPITFFL